MLAAAAEMIAQGERFALVTSVAIKGGTARELGSLALVTAAGQMVGYLSNGCIDQDIRLNALSCLEDGKRKLVHYGEGSPFPDLTLPCGGMLKVLLDPAPDIGSLANAYVSLQERKPAKLSFATDPAEDPLIIEYDPKPRITLAGRGAVFRAAAKLAHSSGFEVFCLTPDEEDAAAVSDLCEASVQRLLSPRASYPLYLDHWSAFLTLFHDHSWEPNLLKSALGSNSRFVGALGSKRTHESRLGVLAEMGCTGSDLARIRGPVGLVSSLRSADLIAVSVMAEVTACFTRSQRRVSATAEFAA